MLSTKGTLMRARSLWFVRFVLPLAILLALGDLHCALTGGSSHRTSEASAAAPMKPGHECCRPSTDAASTPTSPADEAPPCCGCKSIPAWTLPTDGSPVAAAPAASLLAVLIAVPSLPLPLATWTPSVPATASPPPLLARRAHGLRAPPTTV
jgi:hypothetical protein